MIDGGVDEELFSILFWFLLMLFLLVWVEVLGDKSLIEVELLLEVLIMVSFFLELLVVVFWMIFLVV